MFRSAVFACGLMSATLASAHHAECTTDSTDGFMSCGAHSGQVSFSLQNFGDVKVNTQQLLLCGDKPVAIEKLNFQWVESDDSATHFPMQNLKTRQISPECFLLGGLNFTPPADYAAAEQNAWKLDIYVNGVDVPSSVYVEARPLAVQ